VADPVAAGPLALADAGVATQGGVVTGQPAGHGQQLLEGDPGNSRVGVGGEVAGQQGTDGLVQALELPLAQGNPDQRRDDTLGHRLDVVAVAGGHALPVVFIDQVAVVHDEHAAELGVQVGDVAGDGGQDGRVYPFGLGRRGAPAGGRPVVPLSWGG
jgi:hypothetical protein